MEWIDLVSLGMFTLVIVSLVNILEMKLSKAVHKHRPDSVYATRIAPAGIVFYACMTTFFIVCAMARAQTR
ncbi:MAG: hypothetical protein HOI35_01170 [Woeseia sp.]|jgi:hypothetical protein|nr:hypothetical protein [Woeseia sp.]